MEECEEFDSNFDGEFIEKWLQYKQDSRKHADKLVFGPIQSIDKWVNWENRSLEKAKDIII